MTNILALITILFLSLIVYLIIRIQSDRQKFNARIKFLEAFIVQLSNEQKTKDNQVQLSEELKEKLVHINQTLSQDIHDINFKLIEELYPRK
jgi:hypothetical protein